MWNLKIKTNKQNKIETDSQIQETNWLLPDAQCLRGMGRQTRRRLRRGLGGTFIVKYVNHGDEMSSTGNIVNTIVIILQGDRW